MSFPDYGARIRAARALRDLSQAQLAEKVGVSQGAIAQWEDHGNMRMEMLAKLAKVLGVSEAYLSCHDDCMSAVEEFVTRPASSERPAKKRKPLRTAEAHANRKRGKK